MSNTDRFNIRKLTGSEDYSTWAVKAKAMLTKDDLIKAIKGPDASTIANQKALAIIQLLCEDGPLLHIKDMTNAYEAWQRLKDLYNPRGFTTEFLLLRKLFNTHLSTANSMEDFLNTVRRLYDDLKSKDCVLPEQAVMAWILNSLTDEYDAIVSSITQSLRLNSKAYSCDSLFANLLDESRGKEMIFEGQSKAFHVQKTRNQYKNRANKGPYCTNCKRTNHKSD